MRTILVFALFLCIQNCSGRYFIDRFFRYKPRMPEFIKSELLDEACVDDPDYADGCGDYAAIENYCNDQKEFMTEHCAKTCGFCSEATKSPPAPAPAACVDDPDYADGCGDYAAIENYCNDQKEFMTEHCAETCGFCSEATTNPPAPAPAVCEDNPSYAEGPDGCAAQAAVNNYCNDQYEFMSENCPKSCGFCSEVTTQPPVPVEP